MSQVSLAPEPSNSSYWSVDIAGVVAGQPYQFSIVNKGGDPHNPGGILTRVDAYARQVESAEDNARGIIVDWQQQWSTFATPKFADLIIYEAHVGSFAGLNDHLNISTYATFADFETKLGYIRELGFNALQLLPTEQVDGIDGEGYGATNLFAPHNCYGTPAQLRSLVDAAHRHGLAVIFDNGENTIDNLKSFIGWIGFDRSWNFVHYLLGSHDRIADSQSGKQPENRYFVELCGGRDNWYARAKARLGWALNVAIPGTHGHDLQI